MFLKPGGLNSWDQSRSRTSLVLRPTFLKCQDYPSRQDQLLFFLGWDFSIKTWLRRDFCQDCRDKLRLSRFLRFVETFQDLSRYHNIIIFEVLQDQKSRQIVLSRSWSRSRLMVLEGGVETKLRFLNLDQDFSIVETSFLKLSRFSFLKHFILSS